MVLFPHVLRICAIAIVFNNVHGYVFLAGNIEDFKSIANRFLSEDVARKLMDLVVKASGTDKDAGRQKPDDIQIDIPVSKITTTEKEKLNVEVNITPTNTEFLEQSTESIYDRKRYKTIGRAGDSDTKTLKKIPSHIQTKKSAGAANVREEYEKRLKQYIEDYTYNDDDKKLEETKTREPFNKFREERAEAGPRQVENKKTYDYTETKLGEWNINQKPARKPVNIQNGIGKTGYTITGVNMEKEAINTHILDTQYNVNIEQHKYLSSINNHKTGDDYETNKDDLEEVLNDKLHDYHLLGPNNKMKHKNIIENMYIKNTRESNNKDSHIPLDDRKVNEREKYNDDKYVYGSQEKDISNIKSSTKLRMVNYTDVLNSKYSNIDNSNENKDSHTRKPSKQYVVKDNSYEESEVGRKTENKKERNDLKQHDIDEKDNRQNKKERNGLKRHDADEQDNRQSKGKNELYSKYDLGSKTKDSLELYRNTLKRKLPKPQIKTNEMSENEDPYTKTDNIKKPEITKQKHNEVRLRKKPVETNDMYDKYILGSKTGDSEETKLPEHKDNYKAKPMKQPIEEDGMYKYLLGEPKQSKSIYTLKTTTSHINEDRERKRKHVKPIEQNDSYEKFILGSIDSKEHQVSKQEPPKNKQRQQIENDRHKELDELKEKRHQRQGLKNDKQLELGKSKERKPQNYHVVPNEHSRLRNKKRLGKKVVEFTAATETPFPGFVDDPLPDFKEVKAEAIKARTESLIGDNDEMFTMKGTGMPTRKVYKMSSPDYYRQQPRIVDKYDFNEPLPEKDREREKKVYITREPASVNRKIKLPLFDKL